MSGEMVRGFRPSARFIVATAALLAAVSACSGGGGDDPAASPTATKSNAPGQQAGGQSLGVVPMTLAAGSAHIELTALSRTPGNTVTGQFRVGNDGPSQLG